MTGGTIAGGITFAVLCVATGRTIGYPIGHARGLKHAAEDAENTRDAAIVTSWKDLTDEDARPSPPWPTAPPRETPRAEPGKHRHPAGPRHAALPAAGYLPAPGPWDGTITVPAPVQRPPWETPQPEPRTEVPEPTAVLSPTTDTAWTREMAAQVADMDRFITGLIGATDPVLKEITR